MSGRLGLIAGAGALPAAIAQHCRATGRPIFVVRLADFANPALAAFEGDEVNLGQFGRAIEVMKAAGCETVCFAGAVSRPDFARLVFDDLGMAVAPRLLQAAREGDDALLRAVSALFAEAGFRIEGAHEAMQALLLPARALGAVSPEPEHRADIQKAFEIARAMGRLDVGQGAVVASGLVLAVEAQEGTDAMLARVAGLPAALRGGADARRGVLAKAPKPIQDRRLDLPVIGPVTIEAAAAAGLAGVVGEAGGVILLDRPGVVAAADRLGLFVLGVEPAR